MTREQESRINDAIDAMNHLTQQLSNKKPTWTIERLSILLTPLMLAFGLIWYFAVADQTNANSSKVADAAIEIASLNKSNIQLIQQDTSRIKDDVKEIKFDIGKIEDKVNNRHD